MVKDSARIPVLGDLSLLTSMAYRRSFIPDLGALGARARVERNSTTCSPSVQQRPHRLGGPHRCPFLGECMHGRAAYTPSHRERRQRRRPSVEASRRPGQMPSTSVTLHHIFVGRIGHRRRWPYTNWDGAARITAASLVSLLTFSYSNSLQ